jgi:hypothetical protein
MTKTIFSIISAVVLLLTGACAKEGTVYDAPIDKVYEKLTELDLGKGHESAVFRYNDSSPPTDTKPNESVSWFMGKNGKGTAVIAHLNDEGSGKTRVFVEVQTPDMGQMAMFKGFASNMIRERIASYLEERPYNDQKFVDAMYGGNASLVPKEMREAGTSALKMEADMQRDMKEMEENGPAEDSSSVSRSDVRAGAPMVDPSKYNH